MNGSNPLTLARDNYIDVIELVIANLVRVTKLCIVITFSIRCYPINHLKLKEVGLSKKCSSQLALDKQNGYQWIY